MEGMFEEDSQLRRCVEHELLAEPNISPEQALKVYRHIHKKYTFAQVEISEFNSAKHKHRELADSKSCSIVVSV